ncbi:MAG: hypothetical protein LBU85_09105 [Treponema sp.]|jgi:ribosomal protein L44E|nr:hypothetical protein [Treponema sp.]
MYDSFEYCPYCRESTWLKVNEYKTEKVGGLTIDTFGKKGRCKGCGREMHIVEVKAIEEVANDD